MILLYYRKNNLGFPSFEQLRGSSQLRGQAFIILRGILILNTASTVERIANLCAANSGVFGQFFVVSFSLVFFWRKHLLRSNQVVAAIINIRGGNYLDGISYLSHATDEFILHHRVYFIYIRLYIVSILFSCSSLVLLLLLVRLQHNLTLSFL